MNYTKELVDLSLLYSTQESLDLAIAYVYSLEEMKEILETLWENKNVEENGLIYLAYPKNRNKLGHSPIDRDEIFPFFRCK